MWLRGASPAAQVSETDVRAALDRIMRDSLRPIALGAGLILTLRALVILAAQIGGLQPLSLVDLTLGSAMLLLCLVWSRWPLAPKHAYAGAIFIASAGLFMSCVTMYFVRDPLQTIGFILLLLSMGSFFLDTTLLVTLIFVTLFAWGVMMYVAPPSPAWITMGFALLVTAILALAVHLIRRQTLYRLEKLRLYAELQKDEIQKLNTHLEHQVIARTADLRERESQLRALSAHLQNLRENERLTLARDLHDELGQKLTSLKINLSLCERKIESEGEHLTVVKFKQEVATMQALLAEAMTQVRNIIQELRPEVLDTLGLVAALEWQLEEFRARTGLACVLTSNVESLHLNKEHEIALFRIFQETLTNIARHAEATEVTASLMRFERAFALEISDNGRGLPQEALNAKGKFGLLGMRERALVFGGEVVLASMPGQGTKVTITMPLANKPSATAPAFASPHIYQSRADNSTSLYSLSVVH